MDYLYSILLFVFVIVCLLLLGIILLQTSQTGGMGSISGGNSYLEGALGGQGADKLLLRTTTVFAVIFMSLAIMLNVIDNPTQQYESSLEYEDKKTENGKKMFIYQASEAFKIWHGLCPEIDDKVNKLLEND